jgi:hypothetical protein
MFLMSTLDTAWRGIPRPEDTTLESPGAGHRQGSAFPRLYSGMRIAGRGRKPARAWSRLRWDEVGSPGGSQPRPAGRQTSPRLALTDRELCETRKSGSRPISRVLSWTTIHLGLASPRASSDLPGNSCGPQVRARWPACFPIWSCSRWGLPCRRMLPPARCALTAPFHPCRRRIAAALGRSALCCTFRGLAPPRRYLAPCPVEPGLSSAKDAAVAWPTPAPIIPVPPVAAGVTRGRRVPCASAR